MSRQFTDRNVSVYLLCASGATLSKVMEILECVLIPGLTQGLLQDNPPEPEPPKPVFTLTPQRMELGPGESCEVELKGCVDT